MGDALVGEKRVLELMPLWLERYWPVTAAAVAGMAAGWAVFVWDAKVDSRAVPAGTLTFGIVVSGFTATQRNMLLTMRGATVLRVLQRTGYYHNVVDYLMQCIAAAIAVSAVSFLGFFIDSHTILWQFWLVAGTFLVGLVLGFLVRNEIIMVKVVKRFLEDPDGAS